MAEIGSNDITFDGLNLKVYDLVVLPDILERFVSELDARPAKIPAGSLNIKTNGQSPTVVLDELLSFDGNKPGDALLYYTFDDNARKVVFNVQPMNGHDSTSAGTKRTIEGRKAIVVMLATYFFHGSVSLIEGRKGQVVKFAKEATSVTMALMNKNQFTDCKDFHKIRFTGLANNAMQIISLSPPTFRSRARRGFGGNRILSILVHLKRLGHVITFDEIQLEFINEPAILEGGPYISLHPDHEANPMADTGKNLIKAVGSALKKKRVNIDGLKETNVGLFIDPIIDLLKQPYVKDIDALPDMQLLRVALSSAYSIAVNISV